MRDMKRKVRIKIGTRVSHDMGFFVWPKCKPPLSEYKGENWKAETKFPDAVFKARWNGFYWDCKRKGYGGKKEYGNGSIFVRGKDSVELIG